MLFLFSESSSFEIPGRYFSDLRDEIDLRAYRDTRIVPDWESETKRRGESTDSIVWKGSWYQSDPATPIKSLSGEIGDGLANKTK